MVYPMAEVDRTSELLIRIKTLHGLLVLTPLTNADLPQRLSILGGDVQGHRADTLGGDATFPTRLATGS